MRLIYRGVRYDYTPALTPRFGPVFATGVYRGVPVAFRTVVDSLKQPMLNLVWRGVAHRTGPTPPVPQPMPDTASAAPPASGPATTAPEPTVSEQARASVSQRHQELRQREQAMLARSGQEVGLSEETVTQYRAQSQGKVPHDFEGYDRSPAAMS
ncbi:MAG: DUF4278 domain-containing protein [Elainellaceae cyanobacterium]